MCTSEISSSEVRLSEGDIDEDTVSLQYAANPMRLEVIKISNHKPQNLRYLCRAVFNHLLRWILWGKSRIISTSYDVIAIKRTQTSVEDVIIASIVPRIGLNEVSGDR